MLRSGAAELRFTEVDLDAGDDPFDAGQLSGLGEQVRSAGIATLDAAQAGDDKAALVALDRTGCCAGIAAARTGYSGGALRSSAGWPRPSRGTPRTASGMSAGRCW